MDDLYPFPTQEQQDSKMPYPFVEYKGGRFIQAYSDSRRRFLDTLDSDLVSPHYPSIDSHLVRRELAFGEVPTSRILDAVGGDEELLKGLRRKAELRTLRNKYKGEELHNVDSIGADVEIYCRLASTLGHHYDSTRNLQSLSTLLKINDTILSRISGTEIIEHKYISMIAAALGREFEGIKQLNHTLNARVFTESLSGVNITASERKVVPHLGMIAQDTLRSRAYIQGLFNAGFKPHSAIILQDTIPAHTSAPNSLEKSIERSDYFDAGKTVITSLHEENILYSVVSARSFNEAAVVEALTKGEAHYYIFSGSGILKDEILSTGKKLIHVHPGKLPEYRGSTTFLYSLLAEGKCAATGFIMNKGIDTGDIIASREFLPPDPDVDISRIYDPYIRSQVLVDVVRQLADKGYLVGERQKSGGETYYMIHPLLRTLAIGYQKGELETFKLG